MGGGGGAGDAPGYIGGEGVRSVGSGTTWFNCGETTSRSAAKGPTEGPVPWPVNQRFQASLSWRRAIAVAQSKTSIRTLMPIAFNCSATTCAALYMLW